MDVGSTTRFLYRKLVLFVGVFWSSVSTYFLPLFGFFGTYLFRKKNSDHSKVSSEENSRKASDFIEPKPELQSGIASEVDTIQEAVDFSDGFVEKETPEFSFSFRFPTFEEFNRSWREKGESISNPAASDFVSCELMPAKSLNAYIEETEVVNFKEKELNKDMDDDRLCDNKDSQEAKAIHEEVSEDSSRLSSVREKIEEMVSTEEIGKVVDVEKSLHPDQHVSDEIQLQNETDSSDMDSDSEPFGSSPLSSVMNRLMDSYSDGFLSDGDFEGEFQLDKEMKVDNVENMDDLSQELEDGDVDEFETYTTEELRKFEEAHTRNVGNSLRKFEEAHTRNVGNSNSDFLSEKDFPGRNDKAADKTENSGKTNSKSSTSDWESEDSNKLETLWEHQELIEQLKMELKKVRATGLPTILEESDESPKIMEDLKPWKIDEKYQHADRMDELHKFYKSYRERMRKFDILNYQKMYAIGFLQLRDPLQSTSSHKSPLPSVESLLSQNLWLSKGRKIGNDPMLKFIKELQSDLEVVYVGQMCLSWEILHWQYGKALDLWELDPRGIRLYNEVAGEFQQFQVLAQRFIEDEPFQGPRVQNYVRSRCVLRNLLQVPAIREDSAKDRKKAMNRGERGGDYAITSDTLVEIMEESIRIFWNFVRADKDCSPTIVKSRRRPHIELHEPQDAALLMEVLSNLQKKEKRLKDLLRSGNCLLKRFRKCQEDDTDHVLCFFSQVDMKLVSRVLNMSRITTDQLLWCRNKLSKISFVNRKISVEPSFLLFPC